MPDPKSTGFTIKLGLVLAAFLMIALGGLVVLLTGVALVVTLIAVPAMWLAGERRGARKLLGAWGAYAVFYVAVSTGTASLRPVFATPRAIGEEVCADSGCFAVDKVEKTTAGPQIAYTLFWHLTSNNPQQAVRFPGKGLELYLFDGLGRRFTLSDTANPNPLDVMLATGETVRQSMTFTIPPDIGVLFLTAEYRPFTFQSLLPGNLSLLPRRPSAMIRVQ